VTQCGATGSALFLQASMREEECANRDESGARIVVTLPALCVCKGAFAQDPQGAQQNPEDMANASLKDLMRISVNLDAARKAGLKSSAKLQALAKTVLGAPKGT